MFGDDDFEKRFKRTQVVVAISVIISWVFTISLIGFGIWVILKLMSHFGVI